MLEKQEDNIKIRAILKIGVGAIIVLSGLFFLFGRNSSSPQSPQTVTKKNAHSPVTLVFVGDIMMDRGVRRSVEKNLNGDYNALFQNTEYIKNADIAFANLEGPVGVEGKRVGSEYSFHMDPGSLVALKNAGFDIVSFANNHVGDFAQAGFEETLRNLSANNILYAGAGDNYTDATTPRIETIRGVKIGFLAATDVGPTWMKATDSRAGVLLASDPNIQNIILNAKKEVDILVVSFHWGIEYSPSNARQTELAMMAIDSGADIIVGSHPHVMQRVDTYKGKPIFYSLGNFIFDQYFSPYTLEGMVEEVSIDPDTKKISATESVVPISKQFVPQSLIPFNQSMLLQKSFTP